MGIPRTPEARCLSVNETATVFGVSRQTIQRAIKDGQLPAIQIGSRTLVAKDVVDAKLKGAA